MIGSTVSHYKILEKLGEGGMGVVYKAHDTSLDRPIALKFLPHYLTSDATEKERFYHEARAASALNHPNITTIYEIKEFEGQLYLAMEYVEGRTLKGLVGSFHESPLPLKKILDIAIQVCDGLSAAEEKGIVHRDIKSDNIMMTPKGQVKIMDFGLAKIKGSTKLTKAGSTIGTAAYMSPEQAQGEEVDHRSDIFSFGVVLYELFTTKLPFRGEHQAALMYSLINEEPQPMPRFNDKVSPELERIVAKALAKDKDDRYQHVDDMLADLRRERKHLEYARAGYTTMSTIAQPSPPTIMRKKKNLLKYGIPTIIVGVVIILVAIFNPFNYQITTQKSTAASGKSSLAVMYFENIPDPDDKDHTGEMLTNLLTTSLFQTKDVEVISRERLYDIQKEFGQTDTKSITPSTATKVAQRAGVSMMVLGSILQKAPTLAVTYRLIEVQSGKILSTQRLSGFPAEKIFSLVDTLALLVKTDLHVTPSGPAEIKSVASVTTSSPEAYRSYLEGVELGKRFYFPEAIAAFRKATELDSNFALAYFDLASLTIGSSLGQQMLKKAYALSENVSEPERLQIRAFYAFAVEGDAHKAIAFLENLVDKYPHQQFAYIRLGTAYQGTGQIEKAEQIFRKGLQADSLDKNLWNVLAYVYVEQNKKAEAFSAIDRYMQLAPAEPNPYDTKGDLYEMSDDPDSAQIWWLKAISFRSDFPTLGKLFSSALVRKDFAAAEKYFRPFAASKGEEEKLYNEIFPITVLLQQGQINKARAMSLDVLSSHKSQKLSEWIDTDLAAISVMDYELRDFPAMVRHVQQRIDELKKNPNDFEISYRMTLAIAQLKNGDPKSANALADEVKEAVDKHPAGRSEYEYGKALLSVEAGTYDLALEQFNSAMQSIVPNHPPLYHHALCLLRTGHTEEAIHEFARLARWSPTNNVQNDLSGLAMAEYWYIGNVKAHYWLGVAYEQLGRTSESRDEFRKFTEIWKDADFKSVELQDAKMRLTKLNQ